MCFKGFLATVGPPQFLTFILIGYKITQIYNQNFYLDFFFRKRKFRLRFFLLTWFFWFRLVFCPAFWWLLTCVYVKIVNPSLIISYDALHEYGMRNRAITTYLSQARTVRSIISFIVKLVKQYWSGLIQQAAVNKLVDRALEQATGCILRLRIEGPCTEGFCWIRIQAK